MKKVEAELKYTTYVDGKKFVCKAVKHKIRGDMGPEEFVRSFCDMADELVKLELIEGGVYTSGNIEYQRDKEVKPLIDEEDNE